MKDLFPNGDWLTDTPRCEPRQVVAPNRRQQRRAALVNDEEFRQLHLGAERGWLIA